METAPRWRRRWFPPERPLILTGAQGRRRRLVGLAVAATLGLAGCVSGPARPATAPGRTAAPTLDWTRSASTALDLGGGPTSTLSAVVAPSATGADWLIAGTRLGGDGTTTATVWSSPNGLDWTATALAGTDGRALAATAWGARTVVVGSVGRGTDERAAVWITGPGGAFAPVSGDAALLPPISSGSAPTGTATMDVVSAGTQGVFAAGSVSGRQAVWYSTDGTDWIRLAGAEKAVDSSPGAVVTALLVTSTTVLAAGTVQDRTHTDGAVWVSPDGISWHPLGQPADPFRGAGDHRIDALAVDSTGSIVAVGAVRPGSAWIPASWISPSTSGSTWSQPSEALPTSTRPQPTDGGTVVRAVTSTGYGLLAVGGSATAQRLWTSTDGQTWTEMGLPGAAGGASDWSADLVGTAGSTTVVADAAPDQPRVLVDAHGTWREISAQPGVFGPVAPVATPAALIADGSRLLLAVDVYRPGPTLGLATSSVALLSSTDGAHWRRLSRADALPGGWIDSMAVVAGSIVAAGSSTTPSGGRTATIWTSATGRTWQVTATFGAGSPAPRAVTTVVAGPPAVAGSSYVAAGTSPIASPGVASPGVASSGVASSGVDALPGPDATPVAQAWSSVGSDLVQTGLDTTATVGAESVLGSCSNGRTIVVVGDGTRQGIPTDGPTTPGTATSGTSDATTTTVAVSGSPAGPDGQGTDGTIARTWATTTGTSWTAGTVSPLSGAGGSEEMDGCVALGRTWLAWGDAPGPDGAARPALWTSADATVWTLTTNRALDIAGPAPLTDLARSGQSTVAVGGGNLAGGAHPPNPAATHDDPVLAEAAPSADSGANGAAGVWSSSDSGTTWQRIATTGPAWASGPLSTDLVQLLGSAVVVSGQVDGRAAVWVGDATPNGE